jgi:hypothetical protein
MFSIAFSSLFGQDAVHRRPAHAESRRNRARRFAACMHPYGQTGFFLVKRLGSTDGLPPCPTRFSKALSSPSWRTTRAWYAVIRLRHAGSSFSAISAAPRYNRIPRSDRIPSNRTRLAAPHRSLMLCLSTAEAAASRNPLRPPPYSALSSGSHRTCSRCTGKHL